MNVMWHGNAPLRRPHRRHHHEASTKINRATKHLSIIENHIRQKIKPWSRGVHALQLNKCEGRVQRKVRTAASKPDQDNAPVKAFAVAIGDTPVQVAKEVNYAQLASIISHVNTTLTKVGGRPLQLGDLVFGVNSLARDHQARGLDDRLEGEPVTDMQLIKQLMEVLDIADGVYLRTSDMCAMSKIKIHNVKKHVGDANALRPAYLIAVDDIMEEVVFCVRGTCNMLDILTDLCAAPTPYCGGYAHWGMLHAAEWLAANELEYVSELMKEYPGYSLHLLGHSLGGGVASLLCHMIHTRSNLQEMFRDVHVHAYGIATPPVLSPELADACRPYVTTLVLDHDCVPRFCLRNVAQLKEEVVAVDWYKELERSVNDLEYVRGIRGLFNDTHLTQDQAMARLAELGTALAEAARQATDPLGQAAKPLVQVVEPIQEAAKVVVKQVQAPISHAAKGLGSTLSTFNGGSGGMDGYVLGQWLRQLKELLVGWERPDQLFSHQEEEGKMENNVHQAGSWSLNQESSHGRMMTHSLGGIYPTYDDSVASFDYEGDDGELWRTSGWQGQMLQSCRQQGHEQMPADKDTHLSKRRQQHSQECWGSSVPPCQPSLSPNVLPHSHRDVLHIDLLMDQGCNNSTSRSAGDPPPSILREVDRGSSTTAASHSKEVILDAGTNDGPDVTRPLPGAIGSESEGTRRDGTNKNGAGREDFSAGGNRCCVSGSLEAFAPSRSGFPYEAPNVVGPSVSTESWKVMPLNLPKVNVKEQGPIMDETSGMNGTNVDRSGSLQGSDTSAGAMTPMGVPAGERSPIDNNGPFTKACIEAGTQHSFHAEAQLTGMTGRLKSIGSRASCKAPGGAGQHVMQQDWPACVEFCVREEHFQSFCGSYHTLCDIDDEQHGEGGAPGGVPGATRRERAVAGLEDQEVPVVSFNNVKHQLDLGQRKTLANGRGGERWEEEDHDERWGGSDHEGDEAGVVDHETGDQLAHKTAQIVANVLSQPVSAISNEVRAASRNRGPVVASRSPRPPHILEDGISNLRENLMRADPLSVRHDDVSVKEEGAQKEAGGVGGGGSVMESWDEAAVGISGSVSLEPLKLEMSREEKGRREEGKEEGKEEEGIEEDVLTADDIPIQQTPGQLLFIFKEDDQILNIEQVKGLGAGQKAVELAEMLQKSLGDQPPRYHLVEVPPGVRFEQIVLHKDLLRDHRCASYREALTACYKSTRMAGRSRRAGEELPILVHEMNSVGDG